MCIRDRVELDPRGLQNPYRSLGDLRADAVAGDQGNVIGQDISPF
jgi:hypothetical protein